MPVFNKMVYNGTEYILGGGGNIGEPLNLTVIPVGLDAIITWEDNEIGTIPPTTFQKSELVRKVGSAPTSPSDGDLVVTETVKDTYKTVGYVDQGLTDGETYYYRVFSYSDLGGISYCDAVSVTPSSSTLYTITGSTIVGTFNHPEGSDVQGCYISPDGTKMYIDFWSNKRLYQYSLSTPRDVTTATSVRYINVTTPDGIYFDDTGTYMFISCEDDNSIKRYTLSTPRDISTATQDQSLGLSTYYAYMINLSEDGKHIYYGRYSGSQDTLYSYDLATAWDLTTATNQRSLYIGGLYLAISVKNNGKYLYYAHGNGTSVKQYELSTPYDITSNKTEIGSYSITPNNDGSALFISNDLKYWTFGTGAGGTNITQYQAQPIS